MRTSQWKIAVLIVALAFCPTLALAEFDMELAVAPTSSKLIKIEKPGPARDFQQHMAIYLRVLPVKGNRVFPVFIDTHNYLTCPDSEKRSNLTRVSRVNFDKPSGIAIFGFFFPHVGCDRPTFHMEAVVGES